MFLPTSFSRIIYLLKKKTPTFQSLENCVLKKTLSILQEIIAKHYSTPSLHYFDLHFYVQAQLLWYMDKKGNQIKFTYLGMVEKH